MIIILGKVIEMATLGITRNRRTVHHTKLTGCKCKVIISPRLMIIGTGNRRIRMGMSPTVDGHPRLPNRQVKRENEINASRQSRVTATATIEVTAMVTLAHSLVVKTAGV
jgi:hypothetical protein